MIKGFLSNVGNKILSTVEDLFIGMAVRSHQNYLAKYEFEFKKTRTLD